MIKYLKIVALMLLFVVAGFIHKVGFDALKSKFLSPHENQRKSLNNSDDLLNMNTEATSIVPTTDSSKGSQISLTLSLTTSRTPISNFPPSHLNPVNVLKEGNGIIFVETTDRMQPPSLVLCAIESAAHVYKDRPVAYFMKGLNETNSDKAKEKYFPMFISSNNIYIFPLNFNEVFAGTPLLSWYNKVDPTQEKYWTHVSADGCRLALIWKYGGIYMDTDIISIRPIPHQNFLAAESNKCSSNGVFGFPSHHNFTMKSMEDFVLNYRGAVWGYQGPSLFTRILKTVCNLPIFNGLADIACGNITFLHPKHFYPIPYPQWKRYYEVWTKTPNFDISYGLHLWNYMNRNERKAVVPGSNSLVERLYKQYCPSTYQNLTENKTTFK